MSRLAPIDRVRSSLVLCLAGTFLLGLFAAWTSPANADQSSTLDMRLELVWKSTEPRIWAGEVSVSGDAELQAEKGRLSEPRNLTPGMLLTGGIYVTPENDYLRFAPPPTIGELRSRNGRFVTPESASGGVAFRVSGKGADRLIISIRRDGTQDMAAPVAISLQDLANGKPIKNSFNDTAQWTVRRAAGDRLRVTLTPITSSPDTVSGIAEPTSSLFWEDQKARISLVADSVDPEQIDTLELVCDTLAFGNLALATQTWSLTPGAGEHQFNVVDAQWQPPRSEGGYRLRWRLQKKSTTRSVMGVNVPMNLTDSLTNPMTFIRGSSDERVIAESFTDVVVLSRQPMFNRPASLFTEQDESLASLGKLAPFARSWSVSRLVPLRQVTQFTSSTPAPVQLKKATIAGRTVAELSPAKHWAQPLPTSKIGNRHRLKVTIPDGKPMRIGVCVIDRVPGMNKNVVIRDVTSVRTRLSGNANEWATIELDYYPLSGSAQLVLINRDATQSLAFESVEVFAVNDADKAAVNTHSVGATVGQVTNLEETTNNSSSVQLSSGTAIPSVPFKAASRRAMMHIDMAQWLHWFGSVQGWNEQTQCPQYDLYTASVHLIDAVKRQGYRGVVMTVCEDGHSMFPTSSMTAAPNQVDNDTVSASERLSSLELLLRLFDREELAFLPCVRPNFPMTKLERAIAAGTIGRGIALTPVWNSLGIDVSLSEFESCHTGIYNPTHDQVAEQVTELVHELAMECESHRCVDTIGVISDEGSCLDLPAKREMLDSSTLDRFHASLPEGAPARSQMVAWVADKGADAFDEWRSGCLRSLYARLSLQVGHSRKSLMAICTRDQLPIERLMTENGAPILYARLYRRSPLETLADRCHDEQTSATPPVPTNASGITSDVQAESWLNAALFLMPSSGADFKLGYDDVCHTFGIESRQPSSEVSIEPLGTSLAVGKLLNRSDRTTVAIGSNVALSGDAVTRRSLARFNALPPTTMMESPSADDAMKLVKVRSTSFGGAFYIAVTNHSRWPMSVMAMIAANSPIEPVMVGDTLPVQDANGALIASLAPGELYAVRVRDPHAKIRAWTANIDGGPAQVAGIGKSIRELTDSVATMTEPRTCECIENADFEAEPTATVAAGNSGTPNATQVASASTPTPETAPAQPFASSQSQVAGWLLAQHPVGCATLDSEVAQQGKRSIRLRNSEGRPGGTWIVSRQIATPSTGRLAVSLMLRGQPSEDPANSEPIMVRVAIEGNVAGSAMRQAEVFRIPRDGKWSQTPCRVEVNLLPRCGVDSLRLAIDVMNEGTVWIDSVRAEDSFMTDTERSHLQSQMFLALGGVSKGELSHAAKLLESHWVQQMLGGVAEPPRPAILQTSETLDMPPPNSNKETPEKSNPGIAERLKGWIPRPIRF